MARLEPQEDRYDPEEPLLNPGWPVLIKGKLYRVCDEILLGMEGQPDLEWGLHRPIGGSTGARWTSSHRSWRPVVPSSVQSPGTGADT